MDINAKITSINTSFALYKRHILIASNFWSAMSQGFSEEHELRGLEIRGCIDCGCQNDETTSCAATRANGLSTLGNPCAGAVRALLAWFHAPPRPHMPAFSQRRLIQAVIFADRSFIACPRLRAGLARER